jgi:hypothetical protein
MISRWGHSFTFRRFMVVLFWRIFCNHSTARFHACTGAYRDPATSENVIVGVSFVCHKCYRSWTGDIKACGPPRREVVGTPRRSQIKERLESI